MLVYKASKLWRKIFGVVGVVELIKGVIISYPMLPAEAIRFISTNSLCAIT